MIISLVRFVSAHIQSGNLTIIDAKGRAHDFGDGTGSKIVVRLTDRKTQWRIILNPELALGEAFMDGRLIVEQGTIYQFLELVFRNTSVEKLTGIARCFRWASRLLRRIHQNNSLVKSRKNVAHHYDLDGRIYDLFLDSDSQYSCAYFENAGDTLEDAQLSKKRHIAAKLMVESDHSVLDIGSGWGGLGLYLARVADAKITGVTLSEEQFAKSNRRAEELNAQGKANFHLTDYRDITDCFDRIVSVGMFEHVGVGRYDEFFAKVKSLLKPDGIMLLHSIGLFDGPSHNNPWIEKYIFPGGYIPALSEVLPAIERQGLVVCDIEILRLHYADTLRHWRERFISRRDEAVALYDERFARMWEFYLAASETAFRYQGMMVFQIQLALDQNAAPLTRDYIARNEAALKHLEAERLADFEQAAE